MWVKRFTLWLSLLAGLALVGCGSDTVAPPSNGGDGGGPVESGPLGLFEVFLRPYVIQRGSSLAGTLPNPQQSNYALTVFYRGGQPGAQFDWAFDTALGEIIPKTLQLTENSASITIVNDGQTPLGFYDVTVQGRSGDETSSTQGRVAVVELNWMKHQRPTITNPSDPPLDLSLNPTFVPDPGGDLIYFIGSPSKQSVNLWSIRANQRLDQSPQEPRRDLFIAPTTLSTACQGTVDPNQGSHAEEREPDLAPETNGRGEILFASQMDSQFAERQQARNNESFPYNIWVVKKPQALNQYCAKQLTFDASFDSLGGVYYRVWAHRQPRWDPSAMPGQDVRIAFISNRGPGGDASVAHGTNLWLGDLRDNNSDGTSDELVNLRRVTTEGGVISFDWTSDGQSIYFLRAGKAFIYRLQVETQAVEPISLADIDSELEDLRFISVFRGDSNLLTFQGASEGRVFLYVYDLASQSLVRVTPYSFQMGKNLFPRWHPTRREIVFVNDYTVARWVPRDEHPITSPVVDSMLRTLYPSVWTIRLEEP